MRNFFSFFLATILVFSQMGIYKITHYCGGKPLFSEYNIGEKKLSCGMKSVQNLSCSNEYHFISNKPCCDNQLLKLSIDDEYKKNLLFDFVGLVPYENHRFEIYSEIIALEFKKEKGSCFCLTKDIPIWNQSFLI